MKSRRDFLKNTVVFAFSVSVYGIGGCKNSDDAPSLSSCQTTSDILGPFYRPNAPIRTNLIIPGHTSQPLLVKGEVYQDDCTSLLPGALLEFWQSDSEGNYDNESEAFNFRGSQVAGQKGEYSFNTIIPGRYLNGSTFRPSHIHFKITAFGYKDLISQIYFKDDPFIDTDPMASNPVAKERILEIETDANGFSTVHFPIYMSKI